MGTWRRLTAEPIDAAHPGASTGGSYRFDDAAPECGWCTYRLEVVTLAGASVFEPPITVQRGPALYLPLLR